MPPVSCSADHLRIGVNGGSQGTAGSVQTAVTFRNAGTQPCTLFGHPGVSYVTGADGHQVGNAAGREFTARPVTLGPGGLAHAPLRIVNYQLYSPHQCQPKVVRGYVVYPPGGTVGAFSPIRGVRACSGLSVHALLVGPVQPGPAGP